MTTREQTVEHGAPLAPLTTLRLGGPAAKVVEAHTDDELVEAVRACDRAGEPVLVLAGGSNVVIADEGFAGTVVRVLTRGVEREGTALGRRRRASRGTTSSPLRSTPGWPGSSACRASLARPARRRSRTSAPTARTSRRPSRASACYDRERESSRICRPRPWASATAPARFATSSAASCCACAFELTASGTSGGLRYAELARALGVGAATARRCTTSATPCWRCGAARAW